MNRQFTNKFSIRFIVIFLTHFIFKAGDQSFGDFFDFTFRGFLFSSLFVSYWLTIWYIASYIHQKLLTKQDSSKSVKTFYTFSIVFFHFSYGFLSSILFNWLYRFGDIQLFNNSSGWSEISFLNPELTFSLLMIYMMVFSFDTYFQVNIKRKEDQIELEKLKQENTLAKYLNLKSQIEPHFLFNSLSVLNSIIYSDVDLASEFILRLSRILRYVIEKNEFIIVPLSEEITFVENYLFLIKTRFDEGITFENTIDKSILDTYYVPPASLQLLIENAIKHNKFESNNPLNIQLSNTENCITVSNNLNIRTDFEKSTNQGLDNLSDRYSHFTDQTITIKKTSTDFTISLPLLTKEHYERFNI